MKDDQHPTTNYQQRTTTDQSSIVDRRSSIVIFFGVALALLALALRLWGIRQSLPYVNHPDEPNPVGYVLQMLRTGDLNPHAFQKPTLYVYLLLAVAGAHYRWGLAQGWYTSLDQMTLTTHLYTTVPGFFMAGRVLTGVLGSLTVLAVFVVGRLWSAGAGLAAALVLALSAFHIRHSQYVTTDVTSALWVLLTFAFAVWAAQQPREDRRVASEVPLLLAGLCAGLAASTKYNAGVAALMVVAAHLLRWRGWALVRLPWLVAAGAAALGGFLLGTPYALLDWPAFWQGLRGQVSDYGATEHGDFVGAWNWQGYLDFFWGDGLEYAGLLLALIGLLVLLRRRPSAALVWLSFGVPYLLLHAAQSSHFNRNMVPLVVLAALLIGVAVAAVGAWLWRRAQLVGALAVVGLLLAVLLPSGADAARYLQRQAAGDTRVQFANWTAANVPPGARIAAELRPLPGPLESRWAEAESLPQRPLAWYRQQGYAYLVASSDVWRRWDLPDAYRAWAGRPPLAEFGGANAQIMLGPHLVVYPTGLAPADVPEQPDGVVQIGGVQFLGIAIGRPLADAPQLGLEPARTFAPGEVLALRTFWQVEQPFDADLFIYVHLLDANGAIVAQRDAPPWQGRFPTSTWQPGSIVVDANDLALPATLAPGEYLLELGMFDPASGARPPTTINGQSSATGAVRLGTVRVE